MVPGEIGILPERRGVTGTLPGVNGPYWPMREKRRAGQGRPRAPSPLVRIGQGRGGGAPLSFSTKARGGSPTPGGSRTPPGAPQGGRPHLPLPPLYTGAGGHPITHKLIYGLFLSRVRCPPPPYSTSVISSRSLGEALRR